MAKFTEGNEASFQSSANLTTNQFYIVKLSLVNSAPQLALCSASTDRSIGVLNSTPALNEWGAVHMRSANGTFKVKAGGTVAIGDALTSDANGKAITTVTSGDQIVGYAVQAGVLNDVIEYMPSTGKV